MEAAGRLPSAGGDLGLRQQIAGQVLPVEVIRQAGEPATVWMDQSPPQFGAVVRDRGAVAVALGLAEDDLTQHVVLAPRELSRLERFHVDPDICRRSCSTRSGRSTESPASTWRHRGQDLHFGAP